MFRLTELWGARRRQRRSASFPDVVASLSFVQLALLLPPALVRAPHARLSIAAIPDDETACHHFRFTRPQLSRLLPLLQLPLTISTPTNHYRASAEEGLLVVLMRLAYPTRWQDRSYLEWFGRSPAELCEIFLTTCRLLWDRWSRRLHCWDRTFVPSAAHALAARSAAVTGYPGALFMLFIDGTDIYVERPGGPNSRQRSLYSGHHRQHAFLWLVGATTNGIIATLDGPFPGSSNDAGAYAQCGLEGRLRHLLAPVNAGLPIGHRICAAADPGFPISDVLQTRITAPVLTAAQMRYNTALSSVRESVEWTIGHSFILFEFINWCHFLCLFFEH